jgi:hypothetical protein
MSKVEWRDDHRAAIRMRRRLKQVGCTILDARAARNHAETTQSRQDLPTKTALDRDCGVEFLTASIPAESLAFGGALWLKKGGAAVDGFWPGHRAELTRRPP